MAIRPSIADTMAQVAQPGQSPDSGLPMQAPNMLGAQRAAMAGARPPGAPPMPGARPVIRPATPPSQPIPQIAPAQMPQSTNLGQIFARSPTPIYNPATQNLLRALYPGG